MEHKAFTQRADGFVSEIRTLAGIFVVPTGKEVIPEDIEKFNAVWDTGATNTAVASSVIERLGSTPISFVPVGTGGGVVNAPVHLINVVLPNSVIIPNVQVTELAGLNSCDVLIGMDIISQGDFALTHVDGKACFSFRMPSHKQIDFVPESNQYNMRLQSVVGKSKKNKPKKKPRKK